MYLYTGELDFGLDYASCYIIATTETEARQQLDVYQKEHNPYQYDKQRQDSMVLTKHELDKPLVFVDCVQVN